MQDFLKSPPNDEIDLRDLFITLWAYKLLIASTCILGIFSGLYYVQTTNKIYTSTATFKLDAVETMGFSFNNKELGPLASIAGLSGSNDFSNLPIDQITGRVFIQKIDSKLNLKADPYLNTYIPGTIDPVWKSLIKRAIGWQTPPIDAQEIIWQHIINKYKKNVSLIETKTGAAKIVVSHVNPQRAAEIANGIMDAIISNTKAEKNTKQDKRLSYLSNTLAKALGDLEISQSNLKKFTTENSALPLERFAAESLMLNTFRQRLKRATNLYEAVAELSLLLHNKTTNQYDYLKLRQKFPIVDQVEFRRILGQNEIINSWSWPQASTVEAVFDTLSERISRLQSEINELQINADRSGVAMETYAKLEREANIAEATYTVLIEQVKAQSISAGYQPDNSEVYEYASAPINPSSPIRNQILALGAILGLFLGIIFTSILAPLRGVCYSRKALKSRTQARLTFSVKNLLHLRNKSLKNLNTMAMKKSRPILRDLAMEIHKSNATQIVLTSSGSKLSGDDISRALASYMQSKTMKIAIINFSLRAKKLEDDNERLTLGPFAITERECHVSVLRPDGELVAMELLAQKGFRESIQLLKSNFDLVFLSADDSDAISLLRALEGQKVFHITLAKTRKTKSDTLTQMCSHLPVQGLLHD